MESNHLLPPTTKKRVRKKSREVSSRYMSTPSPSPLLSSSYIHSQKLRKSPSCNSSPEATDTESELNDRFANENSHPLYRNVDTPIPSMGDSQNKAMGTQRKTAIRLFGDNGANVSRKARPATPIVSYSPKGAILSNTHLRNGRGNASKSVSSRINSFRSDESCSENSSVVGDLEMDNCSVSANGGFCDSPPINGSRVSRNQEGFRSSMPEADLLPTMSSRRIQNDRNENNNDHNSANSSICCRSLNLVLSSSQQNPFQTKNGRYIPSKICLPPQVPSSKLDGEFRKGKKGSSKQEDIHTLKLCYNKYLQWRLVNAKAKEAVTARTIGTEKSLYGLSVKIAEMKNSVIEKRIEVDRLKGMQSLSFILESQMPYLDNYSNLEEDYSKSLSGVTKALRDASLRLPITGSVRADINELKDAFDSTMNIFSSLTPCIQRFKPKAEAIEDVLTDLAELASTERSLIEECGNLLSEAHNLQVTESSLRGQLIQAKQSRQV